MALSKQVILAQLAVDMQQRQQEFVKTPNITNFERSQNALFGYQRAYQMKDAELVTAIEAIGLRNDDWLGAFAKLGRVQAAAEAEEIPQLTDRSEGLTVVK